MSATLPGNPHAATADSSAVNRDAYVQAQATLALAHEVRTVALILQESRLAAHGTPAGRDAGADLAAAADITSRLGA